MSQKNKTVHVIITSIVVIGVILSGLIVYNSSVNKSLENYTNTTIYEVMEQQNHSLETLIDERKTIMKTLSKVFSASIIYTGEGESRQAVLNTINDANSGSGFEQIILCDPLTGLGLTSKNEMVDLSAEPYFKEVSKDEISISQAFTDAQGKKMIAFSTPIYVENTLVSVLIGYYGTQELGKAFTSAFEKSEFTFVADSSGNVITKTKTNIETMSDEAISNVLKSSAFKDLYENNQSGPISYTMNGQKMLMQYAPVNVNDWYIFSSVPYNVIAKEANSISLGTLVLTLIITGAFVLILLYFGIKQKKYAGELFKTAYYDKLTNMPNLEKFKLNASELIVKNPKMKFFFIIFDINNFKMINEMYGKSAGDEVICAISSTMQQMIQKGNCAIGRINADTFILIDNFNDFDEMEVSRHIFEDMFKANDFKAKGHKIEFRYGRYIIEEGEKDVENMIEKAHLAHNIARKNKNNCIFDYDQAVKQSLILETEIENLMEDALENGEFVVYLQPKYKLETEVVVGAEALVRWVRGNEFMAYPNEFIPIFEKNGFILKLDMYMLDQVCQIIRAWIDEGKQPVTISVNFSRLHLSSDDFVKQVETVVHKHGIPKKYIELELTESTMFDNEEELQKILSDLHESGFTLSMDDFGTGYSSLGLLKNLPVDVIKIDRGFFTDNKDKMRSRTIIESVIQMAKKLKIHTVAEGVESKEHIDLLKDVGCDIVQGYYYAKPEPASEFIAGNAVFNPKAPDPENVFDYEDIGDISIGRTNIGLMLPVAVYRLFQFSLRKILTKLYGETQMIKVLRGTGKLAGRAFARELLDLSLPFNEFAAMLVQKLEETKIGLLKIESFDESTGTGMLAITDDLDCSGVTNLNETLCQYDEGFIAGILYEYTKTNFSVIEVSCWGTGGDACRFEVKPK